MQRLAIPNYRQQKALEAIDRSFVELSIAIRTHTPNTEAVREALHELATLNDLVKTVIVNPEV